MPSTLPNQTIAFIPVSPLYVPGTSTINNDWRIFFQTLWLRTGGTSNQVVNVTDLYTTDNGTVDVSQLVYDLLKRVQLLETNDGFGAAIQALESINNAAINTGLIMAFSTLQVR
jgi:hypothetical protein